MLAVHLPECSFKGILATEPLIYNDTQGILVTASAWLSFDLLRGHVKGGSPDALLMLGGRESRLRGYRQAEVTDENLALLSDQEILWFDVTVDHLLIMSI